MPDHSESYTDKFNEYTKFILLEQCRIVGADFDKVKFNNNEWYSKFSWTRQQENEFIEWLTNLLYNDTQARNQIMEIPIKRKKHCKDVAKFWVFNYGWKVKDEDTCS